MRLLFIRLVFDEQAQDLIEYVLLSAGLGFVGIAAWPAIQAAIGTTYTNLDIATQGLWVPPPPGSP